MRVLLDNSVVDKICSKSLPEGVELCITTRSNTDNPEYTKKYTSLKIIDSIARFGHSTWGGGDVWASDETSKISDKFLALGASQSSILNPSKQTNHNQRDDADIITAAVMAKVEYLISDDKKFLLKNDVRDLAIEYNLIIMGSDEFIEKLSN